MVLQTHDGGWVKQMTGIRIDRKGTNIQSYKFAEIRGNTSFLVNGKNTPMKQRNA